MKKTGFLNIPDRFFTEVGPAYGLTHADLDVLARVASFPNGFHGTLRNLGYLTMLRKESVARSLKKLVEKGLLTKEKNEEQGVLTICYRCYPKVNEVLTKNQRGVDQKSTGNNIYNNIENNKENLIKEKGGKKEFPQDREFDNMWKVLGRGDRDRARTEWEMLSEQERGKAMRHITHYVEENRDYCVTLERYIHNRLYDSIVYYKEKGGVRYDPDAPEVDYTRDYCPRFGVYRKSNGLFYYDGVYTCSEDLRDGLDWNERPDGQTVYLTRYGGSYVTWKRNERKWILN